MKILLKMDFIGRQIIGADDITKEKDGRNVDASGKTGEDTTCYSVESIWAEDFCDVRQPKSWIRISWHHVPVGDPVSVFCGLSIWDASLSDGRLHGRGRCAGRDKFGSGGGVSEA